MDYRDHLVCIPILSNWTNRILQRAQRESGNKPTLHKVKRIFIYPKKKRNRDLQTILDNNGCWLVQVVLGAFR